MSVKYPEPLAVIEVNAPVRVDPEYALVGVVVPVV